MIPDLGKYYVEVLSAYVVTLVLLALLIAMSWLRARRVRRALEETEQRRAKRNG